MGSEVENPQRAPTVESPSPAPSRPYPARTRNTQQRKAVLEATRALNGTHPTASDIFDRLREDHPHLSLATVYRALHALVEQKALIEMRVANTARYDAGTLPHHHLVCLGCGAIVDVERSVLSPGVLRRLGRQIEQAFSFVLDDSQPLQFSGICPDCRR